MKLYPLLIAFTLGITPYKISQKVEAKNISVNIDPIAKSNKLKEEGLTKWRANDNHGAIKDYTESLKLNPKNVDAYLVEHFQDGN